MASPLDDSACIRYPLATVKGFCGLGSFNFLSTNSNLLAEEVTKHLHELYIRYPLYPIGVFGVSLNYERMKSLSEFEHKPIDTDSFRVKGFLGVER